MNGISLVHSSIEKARAVNLQQLRISKIYFDRFSACINSYAVGQRVFLKQPNRQKLQLRYPKEFEVVRKIYDNVYEVRSVEDPADVRRYNAARLKPFSTAFLPSSTTSATQTSSTEDDPGNYGTTEPKTVVSSHGPHDNEHLECNTVQSGNLAHEAQQRVRGEATTKNVRTNRQHDVHPADGHSSYITRSVSRMQHERPEDRSGADSASMESQRGRRLIATERGAPQKVALPTQQRNAVTMRHLSTQPAAVSLVQNGKDQGKSDMVVVLSDPDGENRIAAESDCSLTAARLDASDSDRRVRRVARDDGSQNSTVRDELSHISVMCGDSTSEHVFKAPSSGYATAADRDDSGVVVQQESGEADASPSRRYCAGVAQAMSSLGQNSDVDNFPPLFRRIADPERSAFVPAQNPQTEEYDVRYKTRSYSRAVAQTNAEKEKSLESSKTAQGTVQSDLGESTATASVSLTPRTTRSMARMEEQAARQSVPPVASGYSDVHSIAAQQSEGVKHHYMLRSSNKATKSQPVFLAKVSTSQRK